jgi:hypothetical protein
MGSLVQIEKFKYLIFVDETSYGVPKSFWLNELKADTIDWDVSVADASEGKLPTADNLYEESDASFTGQSYTVINNYTVQPTASLKCGFRQLRYILRHMFSQEYVPSGNVDSNTVESIIVSSDSQHLAKFFSMLVGKYDKRQLWYAGCQISTLTLEISNEGEINPSLEMYAQRDELGVLMPEDGFLTFDGDIMKWFYLDKVEYKQYNDPCQDNDWKNLAKGKIDKVTIKFDMNLNDDTGHSLADSGIFSSGYMLDSKRKHSVDIELNENVNSVYREMFYGQVGQVLWYKEFRMSLRLTFRDRYENIIQIVFPNALFNYDGGDLGDSGDKLNFLCSVGDYTQTWKNGTSKEIISSVGIYMNLTESSLADSCCIYTNTRSPGLNTTNLIKVNRYGSVNPIDDHTWILHEVNAGETFKFTLPKGRYAYQILKEGTSPDIGGNDPNNLGCHFDVLGDGAVINIPDDTCLQVVNPQSTDVFEGDEEIIDEDIE